jgi:hypothetical protein
MDLSVSSKSIFQQREYAHRSFRFSETTRWYHVSQRLGRLLAILFVH